MLVEREMTRSPSSCNNTFIITFIAGQFWTKPRMEISSRRSKSTPSIRKQGWKSFKIMFPHIFKNTLTQVQGDPEKVWPGENLPILWFRQSRGGERPIFDHHCRLDCQVDFLKERFKEKKFFNNEEHKSLLKKVNNNLLLYQNTAKQYHRALSYLTILAAALMFYRSGSPKVQKGKEGAKSRCVMRRTLKSLQTKKTSRSPLDVLLNIWN